MTTDNRIPPKGGSGTAPPKGAVDDRPAPRRGFGPLPCPYCGDEAARVSLDLDDVNTDESFECKACDVEFGVKDVRDFIAKWRPVLDWIDTCPLLPE
jgi:hypothetical protein